MRVGYLSARMAVPCACMVLALATVVGSWHGRGFPSAYSAPGERNRCQPRPENSHSRVTDTYDRRVLSLAPVLYLTLGHPSCGIEEDLSGHGHNGVYLPAGHRPSVVKLPNGDPAASFDGVRQYVQVTSASVLSVTHTGGLSLQAWIRPETLQFRHEHASGYVYLFGKGTPGKQEYALRMYSHFNAGFPIRPNRISAYVFNLRGGLGSGSYFQDIIMIRQWFMVTFVIDDRASSAWPHGYVAIYKNRALRGRVSLSQFHVRPRASNAPLRIATRDLESYFQGAIGKVAIYDYVLSDRDIAGTYRAMVRWDS